MIHDDTYFLEKRASFFRAMSAVTPVINDELDERTRHLIKEELSKMNIKPSSDKRKYKLAMLVPGPSTISSSKSLIPRPSMRSTAPKYTQVNPSTQATPAQQYQPVLSAPSVRS